MTLNDRALRLADRLAADAETLRIAVTQDPGGGRVLDCGVRTDGGLAAGIGMARVCLADLADVTLFAFRHCGPSLSSRAGRHRPPRPRLHGVAVRRLANLRRQVQRHGVRPHAAAHGKEALFDHIPGRERPDAAVGVLETRKPPTREVTAHLAEKLQLPPDRLTLLIAPTASIAGTVQVVARALETALHKLHG